MFQIKVNKYNLFAKQIRIKWIIFGLSVNKKKFASFICAKLFCFLSAHQHISTEKHLHTIFFRETVLIFPWIHTPKSPPQQYLIRFDRIIFTKNSYKEKMNHKVSISIVVAICLPGLSAEINATKALPSRQEAPKLSTWIPNLGVITSLHHCNRAFRAPTFQPLDLRLESVPNDADWFSPPICLVFSSI